MASDVSTSKSDRGSRKTSNAKKSSAKMLLMPFISLHKNVRKITKHKVRKAISIDSLFEAPGIVHVYSNDEHGSEHTEPKHPQLSTLHGQRQVESLNGSSKANLKCVDWSPFESIDNHALWKSSMRRSKASLLMPVSDALGLTPKAVRQKSLSGRKIHLFDSFDQLTCSESGRLDCKDQTKWLSEHDIAYQNSLLLTDSEAIVPYQEKLEVDLERKKRKKHKVDINHTFSLPDISERSFCESKEVSLELDLSTVDYSMANSASEAKQTLSPISVKQDMYCSCAHKRKFQMQQESFEKAIVDPKDITLTAARCVSCSAEKKMSAGEPAEPMRENGTLQKNGIHKISVCAFDKPPSPGVSVRPPLPSAPKPISHRDRALKSGSSELLYSCTGVSPLISESSDDHVGNNLNCWNTSHMASNLENCKLVPAASADTEFSNKSNSNMDAFMLGSLDSMKEKAAPRHDMLNCVAKHEVVRPKSVSLMFDGEDPTYQESTFISQFGCYFPVVIAEALWDHPSVSDNELAFFSGDVVSVLFMEDVHWWWGSREGHKGWFPASYVRLRVVQEIESADEASALQAKYVLPHAAAKCDAARAKKSSLRAKVIEELLNTEMEYVRLLKNLSQGFLREARLRPDLFTQADLAIIFGNVEDLYAFHRSFLSDLQDAVHQSNIGSSLIGNVFLAQKSQFQIYSEYCNNHQSSCMKIIGMSGIKKYRTFFESCRLRLNMMPLSLDAFLLTPVQRICKYPLQLKELVKHTDPTDADYTNLVAAMQAMRNMASLINERKRRIENASRLALWQLSVVDWQGQDVVERSTDLIHKGTLGKISGSRDEKRVVFLFDHQLVYFSKGTSRRNDLIYRGRIDLDETRVEEIPDGTIASSGQPVSHSWKMLNAAKNKWYVFYAACAKEKHEWMTALQHERRLVADEEAHGYQVPVEIRLVTMAAAQTKHAAEMKRLKKLRRKSAITSDDACDLETTTSPLGLTTRPPSASHLSGASKRSKSRNRSFRSSLQGVLFPKLV